MPDAATDQTSWRDAHDEAFGVGHVAGMLTLIHLITLAVTVATVAKAFGAYAAPLLLNASARSGSAFSVLSSCFC